MSHHIVFTGRNVEVTDSIKEFITEKLDKIPNIDTATSMQVEVGQTVAHKGTADDFYVRILINLPRAVVRYKKDGEDVYKIFDSMLPSLHKKMVQYKENFRKWEGQESWPEMVIEEDFEKVKDDSASAVYASYEPTIRRKVLKEMSPMTVTEAIERMELLDKDYFVFKDVKTNGIAVVMRKNNGYEMVATE